MDVNQVIILNPSDKQLKPPAFEDFTKICRVCLHYITETEACKNVYDEECKMRIKTLLEIYAYTKIPEREDSLPQNVCSDCTTFLIEIHTFRSRCKVNEDLLIKIQKRAEEGDAIQVQHNYVGYANLVHSKSATDTSDFDNAEEAQIIAQINDERMGMFRCKDCHLVFSDRKKLFDHRTLAKHSRRPGSACPYCGKMFNTTALVQHIRTHTKEKPFICELCFAAFSIKNNLRRHMKTHSAERSHICETCGKSLSRSETLKQHMKLHDRMDIVIAKVCPVCAKLCASDQKLKVHMRYHKYKFLCTDCGKVFATKANLNTHIRVHTGEKPFTCPVCGRGFSQSSSLRTHTAIHNGEKLHKCGDCDRSFAVRGNLMVHRRIHTGRTPHKCSICSKGFCTATNLKKHIHTHSVNMQKFPMIKNDIKEEHEQIEESAEEIEEEETDDIDECEERRQDEEMLNEEFDLEHVTGEEIVIGEYQQEDNTELYYEEVYDGDPDVVGISAQEVIIMDGDCMKVQKIQQE